MDEIMNINDIKYMAVELLGEPKSTAEPICVYDAICAEVYIFYKQQL